MALYNIVRLYREAGKRRYTLQRGVTLEQARRHCSDPETSSSTCTSAIGRARARKLGPWFDSYEEAK
jgi:hypothetical protein